MILLVKMPPKKIRRLPPEGKVIEKPEDAAWKNWFNELSEEEHKKNLKQLGLGDDEFEEWEQMHGHLDEIIDGEEAAAEESVPKSGKKKKK